MSGQNEKLSLRLLIVSSGIFTSRLLGLSRDIVFAYIFGTGTAMAAFVIASTFPNLLRALFGEGAFSHAMIPVFSDRLEKDGSDSAFNSACRVVSTLIVTVAALVATGIVIALLIRPWFQGELSTLTLALLPWLLPYAVMVCACAAMASVLNSVGHFSLPAYSQTIMNTILIAAAILPAIVFQDLAETSRIWFLAGGVLLAGLLQTHLHLRSCRRVYQPIKFDVDFRDPMVDKVSRLMAPALLGAGVMQVNIVVDRILAGWLGDLATTSLYYSQRLIYLPVGLFGVAMSIVTLPTMSQAWARGDRQKMAQSLRTAFRQVLFLTLPTVALLGALRYPVIELLFQRGDFTVQSTDGTTWAMLFYLPGIPAFACAKIAVTPFYGRQDTKTPVQVAMFCLILNIVLNLILMQFLAQGGLALSTTICSTVNVLTLLWLTNKQLKNTELGQLIKPLAKISAASLLAFLAAAATLSLIPTTEGIAFLLSRVVGPAVAAIIVYLSMAWLQSCQELSEISAILRRRRK